MCLTVIVGDLGAAQAGLDTRRLVMVLSPGLDITERIVAARRMLARARRPQPVFPLEAVCLCGVMLDVALPITGFPARRRDCPDRTQRSASGSPAPRNQPTVSWPSPTQEDSPPFATYRSLIGPRSQPLLDVAAPVPDLLPDPVPARRLPFLPQPRQRGRLEAEPCGQLLGGGPFPVTPPAPSQPARGAVHGILCRVAGLRTTGRVR